MGPLGASVRALRTRCGHPESDFIAIATRAKRYEAISAALRRSGIREERCSVDKLSKLVCDLRYFMERRFGRYSNAAARKGFTIFPATAFRDFSEFGPLSTILLTLFRYEQEAGGKELDFNDEAQNEFCTQAVIAIDQALKEQHHVQVPKVFITPVVEQEEAERLRDILQQHGAAIVSHAPVASHVIYPDPDGMREHQTDGQVLIRVLERTTFEDTTYCFVHWFHHPDSYDDWVPDAEVLGHVYVPRQRKEREQWHVQARWVRDLELHNEFMNPLDYEMPSTYDEFLQQSPKLPSLDSQGKPILSRLRLRLRMPKEEEKVSVVDDAKEDGAEEDGTAKPDGQTVENGREEDRMDVESSEPPKANGMADEDKGEDEQDEQSSGADQNAKIDLGNGVFLPQFTSWFDLGKVHDIEKRALPEFFEGKFPSKNEKTYTETRNFMVETWRRKPKTYLSSTTARRHLSGDACSILRVHAFLEHWGLINYDNEIEGAPPPSFLPPPRPLPLRAGFERDDSARLGPQLVLDSGSKMRIKNGKIVKYGRSGEILDSGKTEAVLIRDTDRNGGAAALARTPEREPIEYHCDSCGVDCSKLRFHCATKADVDLCSSCYHNAKYSSTMKPRDFIQMNSTGGQGNTDEIDADVWTESETLLLLEALEMYGANWTLVSEHVGSKGKSQCVIQFLRLPIEDAFLGKTATSWWDVEPTGGEENISPAEMMRRAGARESALATIHAKGSGGKIFSGQPLVFGDQITTVVPFAGMLSSLSPTEIVNEINSVTGVAQSRKRRRVSFKSVAHFVRQGTDEMDTSEELTFDELLTPKVYDEIRKRAPLPCAVLRSEQGERLSRSAASLINHGAIPVQDMPHLPFNTAPTNLKAPGEGEPPTANGVASCGSPRVLGAAPISNTVVLKAGKEVDSASSTAVAVASLSAACVAAAHRKEIEEVEIGRLRSLLCEIRLERIRRKLAHLHDLKEHDKLAQKLKKKGRTEEMVGRVCRTENIIRKRLEEVVDQTSPKWVWAEGEVQTVAKTGTCVDEDVTVTTGEFVGEKELPDFSEEVALQMIRGVRANGEIVADELETEGEKEDVDMAREASESAMEDV